MVRERESEGGEKGEQHCIITCPVLCDIRDMTFLPGLSSCVFAGAKISVSQWDNQC